MIDFKNYKKLEKKMNRVPHNCPRSRGEKERGRKKYSRNYA